MNDSFVQSCCRWLARGLTGVAVIGLVVCVCDGPVTAGAGAAEKAYVDAYIKGLVELGVITQQQADQLRAKAEAAAAGVAKAAPPPKKVWTDTTKVGGYLQFRWNDHPDKDSSLGDADNDFQVRRARIKVEAKPTDRLKGTLQVDLPVGDGVVDVKDAYGEYYLNDEHDTWVRFGQAKMPFGFQIPQSSSRRLTLERADLKAMTPGERDRGVWLFHTPEKLHDRFNELKSNHLGTGDWGLFAVGLVNGQGFNKGEANDGKHFIFRADYPFQCGDRLGQAGVSVITGDFVTGDKKVTVGANTATVPATEIDEHAVNLHFYLPPDPWGVQFEYLAGESAALVKPDAGDPSTWYVTKADVDGWYGQFHYRVCDSGTAFVRFDEMDGFKKSTGLGDLPSPNNLERWSFGYAHDIDPKTELTVQFDSVEKNGKDEDFLGAQIQYKY